MDSVSEFLPAFFGDGPRVCDPPVTPDGCQNRVLRGPPYGPPIVDLFDDFPGTLRSTADRLRDSPQYVPTNVPRTPNSIEPDLLFDSYKPPWLEYADLDCRHDGGVRVARSPPRPDRSGIRPCPAPMPWVTVFGFHPCALQKVFHLFENLGEVNDALTASECGFPCGNFLDVQYVTSEAYSEALSYNGAWLDSYTVLGVLPQGSYRRKIFVETGKILQVWRPCRSRRPSNPLRPSYCESVGEGVGVGSSTPAPARQPPATAFYPRCLSTHYRVSKRRHCACHNRCLRDWMPVRLLRCLCRVLPTTRTVD